MDAPDTAIQIRHDPVRIGQVVANLLGNAIKFTPRGGSVRVDVRGEPDGGATITVVDTGIGIDPAELPRIFDRFFRGSRASEARGSGSGLGLSIVRSIVEMHGGTVTVESRLEAGNHVPRRAPGAAPTAGHTGLAPRGGNFTVTEPEPESGTRTLVELHDGRRCSPGRPGPD